MQDYQANIDKKEQEDFEIFAGIHYNKHPQPNRMLHPLEKGHTFDCMETVSVVVNNQSPEQPVTYLNWYEIKCVNNSSTHYPTVMLQLDKYLKMLQHVIEHGGTPYYVTIFNDNKYIIHNIFNYNIVTTDTIKCPRYTMRPGAIIEKEIIKIQINPKHVHQYNGN